MRSIALALTAVPILVLPLLSSAPAAAQGPVPADRIDSLFEDLDRTDSPGCAAGIVREGALAFADGWGSANLDHELPITPRTVFYMGSVSKQFTAAAVALAARQGHLSLDDDIRDHLPELPDYGAPITVRHLVHHTSGLRDYLTLQLLADSPPGASDEEILELLARQKGLNFPPGDRYRYSNSGYFLLSEILERATGRTLREFARQELLDPVGMRHSRFHDDADEVVRYRATAYSPSGAGFRMDHWWRFAQVGSGGLYSSVEDMALWAAALDEDRVGPPGFAASLLERGILNGGDTLDYAFGVSVGELRGLRTISHGGALAGFRTFVGRFPDEGVAVIVLCNRSDGDPDGRARAVAELVLGDRLAPEASENAAEETPPAEPAAGATAPPDRTRLERFQGRYHSDELEADHVVRLGEDGLVLEGTAVGPVPLRSTAADTFRGGPATIRFRVDDGRVTGYVLDAGRADGLVFERVDDGG